jgi:hypothetical protein
MGIIKTEAEALKVLAILNSATPTATECENGDCQNYFEDFGEWVDHCNEEHPDDLVNA